MKKIVSTILLITMIISVFSALTLSSSAKKSNNPEFIVRGNTYSFVFDGQLGEDDVEGNIKDITADEELEIISTNNNEGQGTITVVIKVVGYGETNIHFNRYQSGSWSEEEECVFVYSDMKVNETKEIIVLGFLSDAEEPDNVRNIAISDATKAQILSIEQINASEIKVVIKALAAGLVGVDYEYWKGESWEPGLSDDEMVNIIDDRETETIQETEPETEPETTVDETEPEVIAPKDGDNSIIILAIMSAISLVALAIVFKKKATK